MNLILGGRDSVDSKGGGGCGVDSGGGGCTSASISGGRGNGMDVKGSSSVKGKGNSNNGSRRDGEEWEDRGGLKKVKISQTGRASSGDEHAAAGLADEKKQEIQAKMETGGKSKPQESEESGHSSEEEDELGDDRQLQGKTRSKQGVEIDRASAGNTKRSKGEETADSEEEDEFGYTAKKIEKRWADVVKNNGASKVVVVDLDRGVQGLGISIAGHRDRMKMATYICGINPAGAAHKARLLEVGDEILEVNGTVLYGRCHLNASAMIKALPQNHVKIVALRKTEGLNELSVKPMVQFPVSLESEAPEEKYASYKGLRVVTLKKGGGGLGIMIMEGRHAELGQGIFISDIQEGSPAEVAGLFVGDMILAVNGEEMVGIEYEHAANTLKKTDGNVTLVVCNASKGKEGDEKDANKGLGDVKKEPEKKEPEKPKLFPKPSKIPSPSKLISSVSSAISSRTKSVMTSATSHHSTSTLMPVAPSTNLTPPTQLSPSSSHPNLTSLAAAISHSNPSITSPTSPVAPAVTVTLNPPNVPSVIVKPATPSPKLLPVATPSTTGVAPSAVTTKMTLLVKNRIEEPPSDPVTCPISPGKETTIEINKDKMGLGLSIVGGSDTLLGSIIIHEVYPDGAAAKDGRLKPGDQLLSVNNEDFQSITHSKALAALRQTPTKVRMVVYRDESVANEDDMYDVIDVELVKKSGKGLGLSIVGRKNGSGVFISDVVHGGIAQLHGGLMKGDMIISVNGVDLKTATQEEAASVLKTAIGPIHMKIGRLKAAASRRSAASTPGTLPATPTDNKDGLLEIIVADEEMVDVNAGRNSNSNPPSLTGSPPQIKSIILERGSDGLGFSIVGGYGSPHGNLPIYVKTVFDRGAALTSGLKRGDQIIAVNAQPCEGLTHHQAVALLKTAKGNVGLTILS